ncbi:alpha/beta-hydrolase [Microstroma glucosiphilum]|uniref:Alpha/beta-hydrolase n=1 Tax=Pseudomicrostroma glucosiphilum TaxID=1684307 RepID=A0A316TZJ1_9BASI|nr:alpha/beta-hydrolase [Pseudomicrostroma glucosiphilum]PWN18400.1 alpha/beta-hydrolase [Pseudomicrostroma glucosiphilum]
MSTSAPASEPVSTPGPLDYPVPPSLAGSTTTGTLPAFDSLPLYYTRYHPPPTVPTRATVVYLHGFVDHMGPYARMLTLFAARGVEAIAFDQRGFGKTAAAGKGGFKKNYTDTEWALQFRDARSVIEEQSRWVGEKYGEGKIKLFVMGHSMGGGITAALFTRSPDSPEGKHLAGVTSLVTGGAVLWSPWITLTVPPPSLLVSLLKLVLRVWPSVKYDAGLNVKEITRDPEEQRRLDEDEYADPWTRVKSIAGPLEGGPKIVTDGYRYFMANEVPLLALHGEEDKITSPEGSKKLVQLLKEGGAKDVEWKGYPKALHSLMLDIDGIPKDSINYAIDWILARA